jgi:hypothetical protein
MDTKLLLATTILLVLSATGAVQGKLSVGVKKGDWIEYHVTTTGTPPEEFNVTWARMEIQNVQGNEIIADVTTEDPNGMLSNLTMTLDIEKGKIGSWFIIPAALDVGDSFYDEHTGGNVTIEGVQQLMYAGELRTITNATTPERIKRWDQSTGVFVVCIDVFEDYSVNATAIRTNMWGAQMQIFDPKITYMEVPIIVIAVAVGLILIIACRRKK